MGHGGGVRRRWLDLLFALYLAVVAFGVFGPNPGESLDQAGQGARRLDAEVRTALPGRHSGPGSTPAPTRDLVGGLDAENVANIAMFVPLGVLFPARWPRRRRWTIPAGVALSAGIELTQLLFLSWRSPSLIDICWNSLGAVLGYSLWLAGRAALRHRRRRIDLDAFGPPVAHS